MPSGVYTWSQTASANASADSSINFAEGQAPSTVNDSARALMASVAKWRDDISGTIAGGGSTSAYTATSNSSFASTSVMNGQKLAIIVNNTNVAGVTLNVDGLGAFPIVTDTGGTAVPAGTMIANSLYDVTFYSSISKFVLHSFFGSPYSIPIGGLLDFTGTSVPNASFVFPTGQQISRTTYSTYFAMVGTTYGVGDGSTTFNVPDLTGRVVAMKEASATRLTSTYFGAVTGGTGATLGAVGGLESHLLTTAQLAAHTHTNSLTDPGHTHNYTDSSGGVHGGTGSPGGNSTGSNATATASGTTGISITNASAGGGGAHNNVQPTIILNKILRII